MGLSLEEVLDDAVCEFDDGKSFLARCTKENSYIPKDTIGKVLMMDIEYLAPFEDMGEFDNGPTYLVTIKWPGFKESINYYIDDINAERMGFELFEEDAYPNPAQ